MNYTEEERKAHKKFSIKIYRQKPEVKKKMREYSKRYRENYPDRKKDTDKRYYETHKSQRIASINYYNKRPCRDPVLNDVVSYNSLVSRRRYHPDLYAGTPSPKECLIHIPKIKGIEKYEEELALKKEQENIPDTTNN